MKKSKFYLFLKFVFLGFKNILPDSIVVHIAFFRTHRRFLDLNSVRGFSDRLNYRKLYPASKLFTMLTDKLLVREYVSKILGPGVLVPVFNVVDENFKIDFSSLPQQFVMKSNHASGQVKVVFNKNDVDFSSLQRLAREWLSFDFYKATREKHYIGIERRVFFEELLVDNGNVPADYKIHCFRKLDGSFRQIIQIDSDRFGTHTRDFFDAEWNVIDLKLHYPRSTILPAKPGNLVLMLEASDKLSKDFNYVRVDLYSLSDRIYFGELTFTSGCGLERFYPSAMDFEFASYFDEDRVYYQ